MLDDVRRGFRHLSQVVRWNARGEADGDAKAPIEEPEGQPGGKQRGLLELAVVVLDEIDGALPYFREHELGEAGQSGLRVSISGGGIPVARAEVPLAVDQRVAHR